MRRRLRRRQPQAEPLAQIADPVLRRVLSHRGLARHNLDYPLADLLPWCALQQIEPAAALVVEAIRQGQRILVVGDYDADGATGTALALAVLRELGARQVDYLVPDRVRLGYGLSAALAELALQRSPDLVLTVDNGISSLDGIARLKQAGIKVVVTDHHLPGEVLPAADAIVNPNQPGETFASRALAGVGVMFYLLLAVRQQLIDAGVFAGRAVPNMARHLDLVALGTVADLVPLDANNRILVEQGLRRMRAGLARPGIKALIEIAGRVPAQLKASDLGFALGPRINAAGRLEHMDRGIACLLADTMAQARPLAIELDEINKSRQALQTDSQDLAIEKIAAGADSAAPALCLSDVRWHEGIVGLVASRLKERFHRPAIAFAHSGDELKGSARSIPGFHLRDALALLDARHPGLIERFGGHAMAAGLTIRPHALGPFRRAFLQLCEELIRPELLDPQWLSDGELPAEAFAPATIGALQAGGPWGQAWEEPLFDGQFEVIEQRIVGGAHLKLRLRRDGLRGPLDAIAFGVDELVEPRQQHLVFQLDLNDYHSPPRPQLIVRGGVAQD